MFKRTAAQLRSKVGKLIKKRMSFFKRKVPVGDQYPYQIHDPFIVLGEDTGYENLYLVGDNWQDFPEKPIIIVLGCNDWKFGFVADYFPEFRVAFGSRRLVGLNAIRVINKLKIRPSQFVIWGYTEKKILTFFLKLKGENVWRIEDGFVRSSALGASHATPYSLVIDKSGFYYNSYQSSDIEKLLNNYDFKLNPVLMEQAEKALQTILDLKVSKYNPVSLVKNTTIKTKKRIAVLGQVDNDASIRLGNPDNWSSEELIKLARHEHPEADIVYRPHPEIFTGYQKSKFRRKKVEYIAEISSPEESIIDFIENVDHVYTITSLTGLEALLRGKTVTVVGVPFYAGWGLTDDRAKIDRRQRSLSLLQLFTGIYLLYPKYLANLQNPYLGFMAAIYRIQADKYIALDTIAKQDIGDLEEQLPLLLKSYKWPAILSNPKVLQDEKLLSRTLNEIPFNEVFEDINGGIYIGLLAYFLVGLMPLDKSRDQVLTLIREFLSDIEFNQLLVDLEQHNPGLYLIKHWGWLLAESNQNDEAIKFVNNKIYELQSEYHDELLEEKSNNEDVKVRVGGAELVSAYRDDMHKTVKSKLELQMKGRDILSAIESVKFLFLFGENDYLACLKKSITLAELSFDYTSMTKLSRVLQGLSLDYGNRYGVLSEFRASSYLKSNINEITDHLILLCKFVMLKPDKVFYVGTNLEQKKIGASNEDFKKIINSVLLLDNDLTLRKVQGYIAIEQFEKAVKTLEDIIKIEKNGEMLAIHYSKALSYNGQELLAKKIIESTIQVLGMSSESITEALRVYVLLSEYKKSLDLLIQSLSKNIYIGEMHRRKCYFGNRMLREAFETFTEIGICQNVAKYYKDKYYHFERLLDENSHVFLIAIFGPGDEIRFASIYNKLKNILGVKYVSIACSPRLLNILTDSFPELSFVATERPRNSDFVDLNNYTHVPGSDIMGVIDNNAVEEIDKSDQVLFVTDLLHRALPDYKSFSGKKYLVTNELLVDTIRNRLGSNNDFLVGLTWRSGVTSAGRNEHYLTIEQLEPLFEIENIQFINLQYDECLDEVAWVNKRYPGKLINFEDIDQYNDFDSVAALMTCMDLIIAPATTVAELAGALGCRTWLFSNSSEIDWRKINDQGIDVWHNSVTIVDVDKKGDKKRLVMELQKKLMDFSGNEVN